MANTAGVVRQAAAVPIENGRVCMVTSRSGKRWVVPKGCLEPGKSASEIALQEAWEEAGLAGVLSPETVGSYFYEKAGVAYFVLVFLLHVGQVADEWPERGQRDRAWFAFAEAVLRADEPGLRELLRILMNRHAG